MKLAVHIVEEVDIVCIRRAEHRLDSGEAGVAYRTLRQAYNA